MTPARGGKRNFRSVSSKAEATVELLEADAGGPGAVDEQSLSEVG